MTLSTTEQALVATVPTGLFINGAWREASDGARVPVEDPSTGLAFASVADATVTDGGDALAASAAQASWAATAPRERSELLRAAYELLTERARTSRP